MINMGHDSFKNTKMKYNGGNRRAPFLLLEMFRAVHLSLANHTVHLE